MAIDTTLAPTLDQIRHVLAQDPVWAAYAIADLQPTFAPYCQWRVAESDASAGLALLFTALDLPLILTVGPAAAVASALRTLTLPPKVYISVREEHLPLLESYYDFHQSDQGAEVVAMYRMVLQQAGQTMDDGEAEPLGPADGDRIRALYQGGGPYTPDAFDPYQLADGAFFGITEGEVLVAVGGTHIVDWQAGIAAIGNMYTHPGYRGRGYARRVLGAIVQNLQQRGVTQLILNVNQQNRAAQRLYQQYGFVIHCPFLEGMGVRR